MAGIVLKEISTRAPREFDKQQTKEKSQLLLQEFAELQNLLFASSTHALLVVIQGMDASGKDGAIRNVFSSVNPQGAAVTSFKVPTEEELSHDFLWRVHKNTPKKGMIQIFNRSHYEDVLVTRIHKWCDDELAAQRMTAINHFEQLLEKHNNTRVLKFYLHVSPEEQMLRLKERTSDPAKMWKYNEKDFAEAALFEDYHKVYEDCFDKCNDVPWTIVPSDQNWYKEYVMLKVIVDNLKSFDMKYPGMKKS